MDQVTGKPTSTYRAYIDQGGRRAIEGFCGTIDANGEYLSRIYAGAASMGEAIAADYHGRFLIELIQNANDVHPDDRTDGEIEIRFDQRAPGFGVVYVANRGSPFSTVNVDALRDMGLSSKPPGESIGNKGLGFRSVHHISDAPAIFSQASDLKARDQFEGFCFRFADNNDLSQLIENERQRDLARKDLPLFHVPVWLDDQPKAVRAFAKRGFATVIALPLRDAEAAKSVLAEIATLQQQKAPMLLFLPRLRQLSVSIVDQSGREAVALLLKRDEQPIDSEVSIVALGAAGRYVLARCHIAESAMKLAIQDGVDKKQLHKHWLTWKGEGEVAIAVRLDEEITAPRLFTYLPMGEEAVAPFAGYLNATFFPSSNRKVLDATVQLNAMLLQRAADLAAATVARLVGSASPYREDLSAEDRARAAIDLLCWRPREGLQAAGDLAARVGTRVSLELGVKSFAETPIAPVLAIQDGDESIGWAAPPTARRWTDTSETFSIKIAAAHAETTKIHPLWPGLGARLVTLSGYLAKQMPGYADIPSAVERASLAVEVARTLSAAKHASVARWTAYYNDLTDLLDKTGQVLAGQPILLCSDGSLRIAMAPAPDEEAIVRRRRRDSVSVAVFSPPVQRANENLDPENLTPPSSLAENFAFLSEKLDWHGALSDARAFLEKNKLVYEFDRESILAQLSRVARRDDRKTTRAAALQWAFRIWRRPQETGRGFQLQATTHRFFVPTIDGDFIPADTAIFSETWPEDTHGRLLQKFLAAASSPGLPTDLTAVDKRRLAAKNHYCFRSGSTELWTTFLRQLNVKRGLQPIALKNPERAVGWRLADMSFCAHLLSPQAISFWKGDILAQDPRAMTFASSSEYTIRGDILWMPGQGSVQRFNRECLEYYAQLIIAWLGEKLPASWTIAIAHRSFYNSDTRNWPSPLRSFLRSTAWLPADEPFESTARKVTVRGSDIWMARELSESFPSFLRRPAVPVMRALERASPTHLAAIRSHVGLHFFDQPDELVAQAAFLADQYASEGFDRYFERRLVNLYNATWRKLAENVDRGDTAIATGSAPKILLARRSGDVAAVPIATLGDSADRQLYVRDSDDETLVSLLEASEQLVFDARGDALRIGRLMRSLYGNAVRLTSEVDYAVRVDGGSPGEGDTALALDRVPRLKAMLAVALESLKGPEAQRLPNDRQSLIERLERVLFQQATTVAFTIDDLALSQEIDERSAFALKVPDGRPVVVIRATGQVNWTTLDEALGALCEAIELPVLEAPLRILVLGQEASEAPINGPMAGEQDLDKMCAALRLSRAARRAVRETLGAGLDRHIPWLKALLFLAGGADAVDALMAKEAEATRDIACLREVMAPWIDRLVMTTDRVLDACRVSLSASELRDALELEFFSFNQALIAVGERPDVYPDLHKSLIVSYVGTHDLAITDRLRATARPLLRSGKSAPHYANAREAIRSLEANPEWLLRYRDVPDGVLRLHVNGWLQAHGCASLDDSDPDLEPLDRVRRANTVNLKSFVGTASPLVKAWCNGKCATPPIWNEHDGGLTELRKALDLTGIFDSHALDQAEMLDWTQRVDAWPAAMKLTLDRTAHDIIEKDIAEEQAKAQAAEEDYRKRLRSIPFNGRPVDPQETDWSKLEGELLGSLSSALLSMPLGRKANLAPTSRTLVGTVSSGWGVGGSGGRVEMPAEKTDMIGRLGELVVRLWLKNKLPEQDIDAAWRSKIGETFTNRPGNDSLGYDFLVAIGRQNWQIEVKGSLNDPLAFTMGETEVRAARIAARARSGLQYWIAYVSNLSDPARTGVELIPNPFSEAGESVTTLLGEGLRYGFRRL